VCSFKFLYKNNEWRCYFLNQIIATCKETNIDSNNEGMLLGTSTTEGEQTSIDSYAYSCGKQYYW
jgi:aminopeptidase C